MCSYDDVFLSSLSFSDYNTSGLTGQECQILMSESHEIVCGLCDMLHSRCTKLLNIRAKVSGIKPLFR